MKRMQLFLLILLCSCEFPIDPDGSMNLVRNGIMKVGVTLDNLQVRKEGGVLKGPEVDLMKTFARNINAHIEWIEGSETQIMELLKTRDLHFGIGGFKKSNPWSKHVGMTTPIDRTQHVVAVAAGENALLLALERFIVKSGIRP